MTLLISLSYCKYVPSSATTSYIPLCHSFMLTNLYKFYHQPLGHWTTRPIENAPIYHVTARRINNPSSSDFHHCLTMFSTRKAKRRSNTPNRGTPLPRIGVFHNHPPRQGQVGTPMDSQQEVSTSWDTRVYSKSSDSETCITFVRVIDGLGKDNHFI
jgi:hypothetical protein